MTEFRLGRHTIKFIPQNMMPTNSDTERTTGYKIEIHSKGILRSSKLVKVIKYNPSPALTIMGFLDTLSCVPV